MNIYHKYTTRVLNNPVTAGRGLCPLTWALLSPLRPGFRRVLRGGLRVQLQGRAGGRGQSEEQRVGGTEERNQETQVGPHSCPADTPRTDGRSCVGHDVIHLIKAPGFCSIRSLCPHTEPDGRRAASAYLSVFIPVIPSSCFVFKLRCFFTVMLIAPLGQRTTRSLE